MVVNHLDTLFESQILTDLSQNSMLSAETVMKSKEPNFVMKYSDLSAKSPKTPHFLKNSEFYEV